MELGETRHRDTEASEENHREEHPVSIATMEADLAAVATATGGKFLTFFLEEEEYGIEILSVREIIGLLPVTPVPQTPYYVQGVVNLRGISG